MRTKRRVLIIGSGGRETALYEAVRSSPTVERVFVSPGNTSIPQNDRLSVTYTPRRLEDMVSVALCHHINLLIIGPERPLVDGLVDFFKEKAPSVGVVGPSKLAAELEGSKIFMKTRCRRWGIPTADFDFAGSYEVSRQSIKRTGFRIIKADGLCDGKGVRITSSAEGAFAAAKELLPRPIVIEDKLEGTEVSVMALCDGVQAFVLPTSRDYKRLNASSDIMTGGMGAYSPAADVDGVLLSRIHDEILKPMLDGMAKEKRPYHGILYAGIMVTQKGPMLLEVNCRFGDPEAQVILPRLKSDIIGYLWATTQTGGLARMKPLEFKKNAMVCVTLASKDYPASGHRLHSIVGAGRTVAEAREDAYRKVGAFPSIGDYLYREDIAAGV